MNCLHEILDESCQNFKSIVVEKPNFDLLYLYQELFRQLRSIILSSTDNLNEKIDRAEELHSNLQGCLTNRPSQFISIFDSFDDFVRIFTHRMQQFQLSYEIML